MHTYITCRLCTICYTNRLNADWKSMMHAESVTFYTNTRTHSDIGCINKPTALRVFCFWLSYCLHRPQFFSFIQMCDFFDLAEWISFGVQWITHLVSSLWIMEYAYTYNKNMYIAYIMLFKCNKDILQENGKSIAWIVVIERQREEVKVDTHMEFVEISFKCSLSICLS